MNFYLASLTLRLVAFLLCLIRSQTDDSIDVLWTFDKENNYEGWAQNPPEYMHVDVSISNGNLIGSIRGDTMSETNSNSNPNLESPSLRLLITNRHYLMIRMMYYGSAKTGNLLLKVGSSNSLYNEIIENSDWYQRFPLLTISDSGSVSDIYASKYSVDGSSQTYFLGNRASGVYIVFDLGSLKLVNSVHILSTGDDNSPKRCLLQKSVTSGVGPFQTIKQYTLLKSKTNYNQFYENGSHPQVPEEQILNGFEATYSRYWRLVFLDNYGGLNIGVREVSFDGYQDIISIISFPLQSDLTTSSEIIMLSSQSIGNNYHMYYIPTSMTVTAQLLKVRLEFVYDSSFYENKVNTKYFKESFAIDYIGIVKAPEIMGITGCLDKYSNSFSFLDIHYNVTSLVELINGQLPLRYFTKNKLEGFKYSMTYDCPLSGQVIMEIIGYNFGPNSYVFINNMSCPILYQYELGFNSSVDVIYCQLPPSDTSGTVFVKVENGKYPGLFHEIAYVSYRIPPPTPSIPPMVSNLASYKVDLSWNPPGNAYEQLTITGYKIIWYQPKYPSRADNCTVGNVTLTSIRGLQPGTEYVFAIAAMSEGAFPTNAASLPTDLYGRRDRLSNAWIGKFSPVTDIIATLAYDIDFSLFNSNATQNISSSFLFSSSSNTSSLNIVGPTGQFGSEGSYGLILVGDSNIENCNVSSTCCDGFNSSIGISSCGNYRSVCAVLPERMLAFDYVVDGISRREVPSNLPYSNGKPAGISILTLAELITNKGALLPSIACGPSLRLTGSNARLSGSVWYNRKLNVREGFDTTFRFRISNPSQRCMVMDDVNTYCRSRGADGFAFVIQNLSNLALGNAGAGLGYEGIYSSLAIEMDTYHNYENLDFYENHIGVMTTGLRLNISANHSFSIATTTKIPDLTDGIHSVRIKYDPVFDETAVPHPSFQVNEYTSFYLQNGDYINGGLGDWGNFGLLYVYVDDLYSPVITTPLNLEFTIALDNGRAYVGFTSATGDNDWQVHDILEWQFRSLYRDIPYTPPLLNANGEGGYTCVNESVCIHHVDYNHYMRTNNVWGSSFDDIEGWMTGVEGVCETC